MEGMKYMARKGVVRWGEWQYAWGWNGRQGWDADTRASKCEPKKTNLKNAARIVLEKGKSTTNTEYKYYAIGDISKLGTGTWTSSHGGTTSTILPKQEILSTVRSHHK